MRLAANNPMGKVLLAILAFEAVVAGLAIAGMITVAGLSVPLGFGLGLGVAATALVAAGLLRRGVGYVLGWLSQVLIISMGLAAEMMFWVGGMFALLWVLCFVLGRRIETAR